MKIMKRVGLNLVPCGTILLCVYKTEKCESFGVVAAKFEVGDGCLKLYAKAI